MIINESNSNKYKIVGERNLDGIHYFVVSGKGLDNIRNVLELQDRIGYPVQMMGMKNEVWIQVPKSDNVNILNVLNKNLNESSKRYTYKTAPKWLKNKLIEDYRSAVDDDNASAEDAEYYWMNLADGEGGPAYFDSKGIDIKLNEAAEDALDYNSNVEYKSEDIAAQISINYEGECNAITGYYKLIPFFESKGDDESIAKIEEIISDEKNHQEILKELQMKYDGHLLANPD